MRVKGESRGVGQGGDCTGYNEAVVDQDIGTMMQPVLMKPAGAEKLTGLRARCWDALGSPPRKAFA